MTALRPDAPPVVSTFLPERTERLGGCTKCSGLNGMDATTRTQIASVDAVTTATPVAQSPKKWSNGRMGIHMDHVSGQSIRSVLHRSPFGDRRSAAKCL